MSELEPVETTNLTEVNHPAVSTVASVGDKVLSPSNEDSEYNDLELGQIIKVLVNDSHKGTLFDGLEGLIYYYDPGKILKIQLETQPTILRELNFIEYTDETGEYTGEIGTVFYDLDHTIFDIETPYKIIQLASAKEFVKINNFEVGQILYSFKKEVQGQTYLITDINDKKDTIEIVEIDEDFQIDEFTKRKIEFNRVGIPLGESFDVLRIHGLKEDLQKQAEQIKLIQSGKIEAPIPKEEGEGFFEDIEIPIFEGLIELAGKDIPASDEAQRGDMITDLRRNPLPEWKGRTLTKDEYLRYVDTLLRLRNDIVEYNAAGESTKQLLPTTIDMLIQLIDGGFPLSRPVLDVKLNTFVDGRPVVTNEEKAKQTQAEIVHNLNLANEIKFNMLNEVVKNSENVMDEVVVTKDINVNEDPQYIVNLKNYLENHFRVWRPNMGSTNPKKFKEDTDFFRRVVPDFDEENDEIQYAKDSKLSGFPRMPNMNDEKVLTDKYIGKVKFSVRRALKELKGRPAENLELVNGRLMDTRGIITVSPADTAPVINYIIFPYLTTRSLGPIRSGKLVYDTYRAATCITLIADLFLLLEGITETPSADSIFLLKKENEKALQNIQISEYIKKILVGARGFEDYEDLFVSIGMNKYELNRDQFLAIQENIQFEFARRKEIIRKLREKSNILAKQKIDLKKRPFTMSDSIQAIPEQTTIMTEESVLFKLANNNKDVGRELAQVSRKTPAYQNIDLAIMAYALLLSPDYVTAVICKNPNFISAQSYILSKRFFQQKEREKELFELKKRIKGNQPQINKCSHVKEYTMMKNTKDISKRMALLKKLFDTYHKGEKDNWYTCSSCSKPFMCKHEWLQIKQFLNPNESKNLYKSLVLNYSGGQFQGNYICKGCGQAISEIEFDESMEFDDNGRPMIGYAPLENDPDGKQKEIDDFNGPTADLDGGQSKKIKRPEDEIKVPLFKFTQYCGYDETKVTNITVLACIREVASFIYTSIGVQPSLETFDLICKRAYSKLLSQKSVLELDKDKGFMSLLKEELGGELKESKSEISLGEGKDKYTINSNKLLYIRRYLNQRLIGYTAALILIDVQTHLPEYEKGYLPGCQATFNGYPYDNDKTQLGAIEYMKCVLNSNLMEKSAWLNTSWRKLNREVRGRTISIVLLHCVEELVQEAYIKDMIFKKQKWFEETYGESSMKEKLPNSFLPVPYNPSKAPKEEKNVDTAEKRVQQQVILEIAHRLAFEHRDQNLVQNKGSTMSCCYEAIDEPGKFWLTKNIEWSGTTKPVGSKGARLISPFQARPIPIINLKAPENLYPRVFLKVCFRGDHMGLPHEPGYDNVCHFCGFDFKKDPATMENIDKEGKEALDEVQGLEITEKTFNELLDSVHKHLQVPISKKPSIQTRNTILENFYNLAVYSYKEGDVKFSWRTELKPFIENELKSESSLPDEKTRMELLMLFEKTMIKHRNALDNRYGSVNTEACLKNDKKEFTKVEDETKGSENKKIQCINILESFADLSPEEIRKFLRTYFIVPLTRAIENQNDESLERLLSDYDLSREHRATIVEKILIPQSGPRKPFKDYFNSMSINEDIKKRRNLDADTFITNLKKIIDFLANFSIKTLRFQSKENILYKTLIKGMIFGAFYSYETESTITSLIRCCIVKYYLQGKQYTEEEIQRAITEIAEKEKQRFIKETEGMSDQDKALDRELRKLGMGKYAVGGTKAIWAYDKERWGKEDAERLLNGQVVWNEDPYSKSFDVQAKRQKRTEDGDMNVEGTEQDGEN